MYVFYVYSYYLAITMPLLTYTVGSDRPAFKYLNRYVVIYVASKWYDVGLELMEIEDEFELDALKAEQNDIECAKKMLKCWLEKKPNASWNDLIEVFRAPHIGLHTLAFEIEGKLSESMYTVTLSLLIKY